MMTPLRARCIAAMTSSVWPDGKWSAEAECMLDAVLPVLSESLLPHRWDHTSEQGRPAACEPAGPDSFYNGIRHASDVIADLMEPRDHQCDGETAWCDACEAKERAKLDPNRGRTEDVQ